MIDSPTSGRCSHWWSGRRGAEAARATRRVERAAGGTMAQVVLV